MNKSVSTCLMITLSCLPFASQGDEDTNITPYQVSKYQQQTQKKNDAFLFSTQSAETWGLTETDWTRYMEIKSGQWGVWAPDLDPVELLGANARSETEAIRYAELWSKQFREHVNRLQWFDRIRRQTYRRLYPDDQVIEKEHMQFFEQQLQEDTMSYKKFLYGDRLQYFVSSRQTNENLLKNIIGQIETRPELFLDIYITDAANETAIQTWAEAHSIPLALVQKGLITLNFDKGLLSKFSQSKKANQLFLSRQKELYVVNESEFE